MKQLVTILYLMLFTTTTIWAGTITGKVNDEKGEAIIGATVMIEGTSSGARTDMDGKFIVKNVQDGKYTLTISYVSFEKKVITDIEVKNGQSEYLVITLTKANKNLKEVVIKTAAKKETINALLIQQKNMATISDGISGEMIKKTADRSTGDVLKRVSGVTIADNKFAVIRGLADRYNLAMLNGDVLPSSESDRKAFSFDIFPSSLLDNVVIVKAATPDKLAEFSGGIINLSTKEIPNENFFQVQIGSGYNTISTGKPYVQNKTSKTDWLGYDNSTRVIPSDFPSAKEYDKLTVTQKYEYAKLFPNNWALTQKNAMPFNRNIQLSAGWQKQFKKQMAIGIVGAVSYNRSFKTNFLTRGDLGGALKMYDYKDTVYKENVLSGALLNIGFKINDNHKISLKNTFTLNAENQTIIRQGELIENQQFIKSNAAWFTSNQLLANQLQGEHVVTTRKIKIMWAASHNIIHRTTPDLRKFYSVRNENTNQYEAFVPTGFASPFYSGTYFDNTKEKINSANIDVVFPYQFLGNKQTCKAGAYFQNKSRVFDARVFGYILGKGPHNYALDTLPQGQIFAPENMHANGYYLDDITVPTNSYQASSNLYAAYLMNDNLISDKLRLVYGVRFEQFYRKLIEGTDKGFDTSAATFNNWLPSINLTYMLNKKTNIRASATKTLSRPEFRELASTPFFNYSMLLTYQGNKNLLQTNIQNYDIRYEYYMGKGELISASVFYKHFNNPIELAMIKAAKAVQYVNGPTAFCYGLELEFRKSLSILTTRENSWLNDLSVFGNFSYIKSQVTIKDTNVNGEDISMKRRMQGQSPYIINTGIMYNNSKRNIGCNVMFNRIGERIFAVGDGDYTDNIYEAPRNVLDIQISKIFYKKYEIKLNLADLLSNPTVYYYNTTAEGKVDKVNLSYQKNNDFNYIKQLNGKTIGLSLSVKL